MTDGPYRTCLGCRQRRLKRGLVRLVRAASGAVSVDATGTAPGRGAYVCAGAACVTGALKDGRLSHAFRAPARATPGLAAVVSGVGPSGVRIAPAGGESASVVASSRR
jgi:uncharacterized protein